MSIDPRHLRHLLAIATAGSFNRAALQLGISQPALSKSIQLLEHRLGFAVMTRTVRGSSLTPAGRILVRRAEALGRLLDDAMSEVLLEVKGIGGPLRIGATPSVMLDLVPRAMTRLLATTPRVSVTVIEGLDGDLLPALAEGRIDILVGPVGDPRSARPGLLETRLIDDPFGIGVATGAPLADRPEIALRDLVDHPWVLPLPGSLYHRHVEALFLAADCPWPEDVVSSNSLAFCERLVVETGRIMTLTALQLRGGGRIRMIPLTQATNRQIGYRLRNDARPSPFARAFLDALTATISGQSTEA